MSHWDLYLQQTGDSEALDVWWEITNECRLRDIFILDILIRLAIHDGSTKPRSLQEIVKEHAGIDITDPVGCHYRYGQRYFTETLATKFTSEYVSDLVQMTEHYLTLLHITGMLNHCMKNRSQNLPYAT